MNNIMNNPLGSALHPGFGIPQSGSQNMTADPIAMIQQLMQTLMSGGHGCQGGGCQCNGAGSCQGCAGCGQNTVQANQRFGF